MFGWMKKLIQSKTDTTMDMGFTIAEDAFYRRRVSYGYLQEEFPTFCAYVMDKIHQHLEPNRVADIYIGIPDAFSQEEKDFLITDLQNNLEFSSDEVQINYCNMTTTFIIHNAKKPPIVYIPEGSGLDLTLTCYASRLEMWHAKSWESMENQCGFYLNIIYQE